MVTVGDATFELTIRLVTAVSRVLLYRSHWRRDATRRRHWSTALEQCTLYPGAAAAADKQYLQYTVVNSASSALPAPPLRLSFRLCLVNSNPLFVLVSQAFPLIPSPRRIEEDPRDEDRFTACATDDNFFVFCLIPR